MSRLVVQVKLLCVCGDLQLSRRQEKAKTISSTTNSEKSTSEIAQADILKATGEYYRATFDIDGNLVGSHQMKPRKNHPSGPRAQSGSNNSNEDILLNSGFSGSFFSKYDINHFATLMKQVALPPGVPHLPENLGQAKHSKLGASQWHMLFFFIVPLVLCEMYVDEVGHINVSSNWYKFLENMAHLLAFMNKYSDLVGRLFEGVKIQPNHHFPLHIPQQMASWGPLSGVTEFPGKHLRGCFQKISTKNKIGKSNINCWLAECS
ncbi:hypothetical protein VP01_4082g1 [Puccinia sorghi]|uniref:Uncharacterized protein n=1 Tax=Puccinia sorghi TaxID=27349 RepID=A0A0L6UTD1_9BASI|nr:hypothetical protein VP01_4082g1 [Puccinia sorghi]